MSGSMEDQEWYHLAECLGVDGEIFFPEQGESARPAKSICAECAVRAECLEFALDRNEKFGIYGGRTVRERKAIRRQRERGVKVIL